MAGLASPGEIQITRPTFWEWGLRMIRLVVAFALVALAAPLGSARAQEGMAPTGARPFKGATPAQLRALKALYPQPQAASGTELVAPADAAYYACLAQRLYAPLSRMLDRPTPPTKEQVSALIARRAEESSCDVEGDARDYIAIKPARTLEAIAKYAETWKPPAP